MLTVPREAFLEDRVYTVQRSEKEDEAEVWLARLTRPDVVAILAGTVLVQPGEEPDDLQSGARVVVTNLEDIADGSRLRILPTKLDER